MVYIGFLVALMIFTVAYLILGGVSLLKNDDQEQEVIEKYVSASLLK